VTPGFWALALAAASVGALHSVAPDHWVPFAALARAQRWSAWKTSRITLACGLGHVTVSAALGVLALVLGMGALRVFGERLESVAGLLLMGFGLAYAVWGLRKATHERLHVHAHGHEHEHGHVHGSSHSHAHALPEPSKLTAWTLFALFSLDPCVAVMPILFAAAPLGVTRAAGVVLIYEVATLAAMLPLVLLSRAGATRLKWQWLEHYGDGFAGGIIAAVGLAVTLLGI
jgi:nickel/cobalt transporter (NicO) family protein